VGRYIKTGTNPAFFPKGILIEGQRTNLAVYSEDLSNGNWQKYDVTVVADNVVAPDGNSTADKLVENSTNAEHCMIRMITWDDSSVYALSVFAKAAERHWVNLTIVTKANGILRCWFDLETGAVGTCQAGLSGGIDALGSGWYRLWVVVADTQTGTAGVQGAWLLLAVADQGLAYQGDNTSGIWLWGAQIEKASFASSYIPTTTAAVTRNADVLTFPTSGNINGTVGSVAITFGVLVNGSFRSLYNQALIGNVSMPIYTDSERGLKIFDGTDWVGVGASQVLSDSGNRGVTRWGGAEKGVCLNGGDVGTGSFDGDMNFGATVTVGGGFPGFGPYKLVVKNLKIWNRALTDAEMIAITS